jgi:predicted dehydrogenase
MEKVRVGIVGCGAISEEYLRCAQRFDILQVVACADLALERAQQRARDFGVPRACSVEQLLGDDQVELVVNLTVPKAHAEVSLAAIAAGKHVWTEKPLGINLAEGRHIVAAARDRGVRLGGAPDTFLGSGHQLARQAIDCGRIGQPVSATAFMFHPGHETWHPNPAFYYEPGGGPVLDMAPYYLTALMNLLGPVRRVSTLGTVAIPKRTITSQPLAGQVINVQTMDHVTGAIQFHSGLIATVVMSFTGWHSPHPPIVIFGTDGTLQVPDPNGFDGQVLLRTPGWESQWQSLPHQYTVGYQRAVGVADMAHALRSGRPHRGSAEQILAVLEVMQAMLDSAEQGRDIEVHGEYQRPAPLPTHLSPSCMDA